MCKLIFYFLFIFILLAQQVVKASDVTPGYKLGVYYFPGWMEGARGGAVNPWERIQKYPDREPLLGWYRDGDVEVAERHIQWMHDYGIDYVVYDWYTDGTPFLEHALSAYFKAKNRDLIKFSILWANHSHFPDNLDQFESMVRYWVKYYFKSDQYMKIDGKPVVFVFSQQQLQDNAKKFGKTVTDLLIISRAIAKKAGFTGIYFIGSVEASNFWVKQQGPVNGFDAFSAYNYQRGFSGTYIQNKRESHSYEELDKAYQESWAWILLNSKLPYIVPMTSGWDKRPWGGSKDSLHDNSSSTPDSFERHLRAAKSLMDRYPSVSKRMGIICCWNEFGEGSYIEPTKKDSFIYLEKIRKVFGVRERE